MALHKIEKLIEKYENGKTSLAEEHQLKAFFAQETVPLHLWGYKQLFAYFSENKKEQFAQNISLKTEKKRHYKWIATAAIAVILLGLCFQPIKSTYNQYAYGTYSNPEEALNEITKSLNMISNHFNKGVSSVGYLNEYDKGTKTLNYLNELENSTQIIFKPNK
ncbi:MAG: hypothetical protein ACK5NB_04435 [Flavobacteriaceae bacterium]